MKKYIALIVVLFIIAVITTGFAGPSTVLEKLIVANQNCSITVNIDGALQTLNDCSILDQDAVMIKFLYPSNSMIYIYLINDIKQIRYPVQ